MLYADFVNPDHPSKGVAIYWDKDKSPDDKVQQEQRGKRSRASCLNTRYGQRWTDESYIKQGIKPEITNILSPASITKKVL